MCAVVAREAWRRWITSRLRCHCYPGSEIQKANNHFKNLRFLLWNFWKNMRVNDISTSIAFPIVWMIRSKTLVRSTSNDLHCRRHLYMIQAAIGRFPAKPKCCAIHRMSNSWFSCCFSFNDFCGFSSTSAGSRRFSDGLWRSGWKYIDQVRKKSDN